LAFKSLSDSNARFANFVQGINARLLLSYEVRTAVERRAIVLIKRSLTRALGAEPAELGAVAKRVAQGDLAAVAGASAAAGNADLSQRTEEQASNLRRRPRR
jgi:methyl-accepting chemotaxis protein-1 (serine sensor receptor)